jgi:hypothetical protein
MRIRRWRFGIRQARAQGFGLLGVIAFGLATVAAPCGGGGPGPQGSTDNNLAPGAHCTASPQCGSGRCGTEVGTTNVQICCGSAAAGGVGASCTCNEDCVPGTPTANASLGSCIECTAGTCVYKPGEDSNTCLGGGGTTTGSSGSSSGSSGPDTGCPSGTVGTPAKFSICSQASPCPSGSTCSVDSGVGVCLAPNAMECTGLGNGWSCPSGTTSCSTVGASTYCCAPQSAGGVDGGTGNTDAGSSWCCCDGPTLTVGNGCSCVSQSADLGCTAQQCNIGSPANNQSVVSTCSEPCCYRGGNISTNNCICYDTTFLNSLGDTCAQYVKQYGGGGTQVASCPF